MSLTIELIKEMIDNIPNYPDHAYWFWNNKIMNEIEFEQELIRENNENTN